MVGDSLFVKEDNENPLTHLPGMLGVFTLLKNTLNSSYKKLPYLKPERGSDGAIGA